MDIIIFDYDGVIVDSLDLVIEIYNELAPQYDLEKLKEKEEFTKFFDHNFFQGLKENGIGPEVYEGLLKEMADRLAREVKDAPLFEGIKEVLKKLSQEYRLLIITSNLSYVIEEALKINDIKEIEEVVGAEKEKSKVKKIKRVEGKYPDSKIYYIGDTTGDIYEGREAGTITVAVSWGFHKKEKLELSEPDYLAITTEELLDIFILDK